MKVPLLRFVCAVAAAGAISASDGAGNGGPVPARPDREIGAMPDTAGRSDAVARDSAMSDTGRVPWDTLRFPPGDAAGPPPGPVPKQEEAASISAVPFGPGEKLEYRVTVGLFGGVGKGSMEVAGIDTVRSRPTYHLRMKVRGGIPLAHVDDRLESWMDISSLASRRFEQDQKEPNWKRHRVWNFFPEQRSWATEEPSEAGALPTDLPLDDVSFLYYVRTLPLEIGQTYTLDRYFRSDGNPVVIKVLRIEKVSVPLGSFETIVVRPVIRTRGLFGQGGEAEVFFSNDARRIPVMMRSKIPVLGHLNLYLEKYVQGLPLSRVSSSPDEGD
jgi:hypothetical protein